MSTWTVTRRTDRHIKTPSVSAAPHSHGKEDYENSAPLEVVGVLVLSDGGPAVHAELSLTRMGARDSPAWVKIMHFAGTVEQRGRNIIHIDGQVVWNGGGEVFSHME